MLALFVSFREDLEQLLSYSYRLPFMADLFQMLDRVSAVLPDNRDSLTSGILPSLGSSENIFLTQNLSKDQQRFFDALVRSRFH